MGNRLSRRQRPGLLHSGEGIDSDFGGAGDEQGLCAFVDRGTGGEDIVNDEEPAAFHSICPRDAEGSFDVFLSLPPATALGFSGADPTEHSESGRKPPPCSQLLRQKRRLVEATLVLPLTMKWNWNKAVELSWIEQPFCRLHHQTTEMTTEGWAAAILEQEDRLPDRPLRFIHRRGPRGREGRRLDAAGSAKVARAFLKGSGRDKWSAAAWAERLGDGPNRTPAPAADEGPPGGVQGPMTDSAG